MTQPTWPARLADRAPCSIALLAGGILLQRIAVPLGAGQVPVPLVWTLAMLAVGLATGEFRVYRPGARALAVVVASAAALTVAHVALGPPPSLFSVGLLLCLYPLLAIRADLSRTGVRRVERAFFGLMLVFAVVSLLQMLVQFLGVAYEDYILRVVPPEFLLVGFNTGDPIAYGDPLYRSNAVVFLEPSFVSLFLGIAGALALYRRAPWWLITVILAGMIPPLAGSGFIVLAPAMVVIALSRRRRNLSAAVPALAIALLVAFVTPLGTRYLDRSTEASNPRTSSSARLVQPYGSLLPPAFDDLPVTLVGHGAGSADDYLVSVGLGDVTAPLIPKVLFEYGLLGGLGILAVIVFVMVVGVRARPWTVGIVLVYLYVNASFLQATLVFVTLYWVTFLPAYPSLENPARTPGGSAADGTRSEQTPVGLSGQRQ